MDGAMRQGDAECSNSIGDTKGVKGVPVWTCPLVSADSYIYPSGSLLPCISPLDHDRVRLLSGGSRRLHAETTEDRQLGRWHKAAASCKPIHTCNTRCPRPPDQERRRRQPTSSEGVEGPQRQVPGQGESHRSCRHSSAELIAHLGKATVKPFSFCFLHDHDCASRPYTRSQPSCTATAFSSEWLHFVREASFPNICLPHIRSKAHVAKGFEALFTDVVFNLVTSSRTTHTPFRPCHSTQHAFPDNPAKLHASNATACCVSGCLGLFTKRSTISSFLLSTKTTSTVQTFVHELGK